ncbi:hypothetical protein M419DRAFT_117453 [Trichoderma reesei RUT C-30]|uniref:Uncharacterized protein n=1 Tax=Hypocrea jecorina (strain ATCC 56765 / BCRC 32924 / NRRL 11460 / Rut C-30) TaxID=1344414 RepID=A0A024SKG2_HYPJR|nr:hypothetical protein M419DRAFT_117453 [Trichoderma reesei RUT C-30]
MTEKHEHCVQYSRHGPLDKWCHARQSSVSGSKVRGRHVMAAHCDLMRTLSTGRARGQVIETQISFCPWSNNRYLVT